MKKREIQQFTDPEISGSSPVDMADAMERFEDNQEFYFAMVQKFLSYVPENMCNLEQAVRAKDFKGIYRAAHGIKGAALNLSAVDLAAIAQKLESMGTDKDITGLDGLIEKMRKEIMRLQEFLNMHEAL